MLTLHLAVPGTLGSKLHPRIAPAQKEVSMDTKIVKDLMSKKNVVSVGKGHKKVGGVDTGEECIIVGVTKKLPLSMLQTENIIPTTIGNPRVKTDVTEVGDIKLL